MAKDLFHDAVKAALIADGWTITDDPLFLRFDDVTYQVDLGAEKILAAEKEGQKIAVEVKGFPGMSFTYQFHQAIGQYVSYRVALREKEPERTLYLAIPLKTYQRHFQSYIIVKTIESYPVHLLIFDPATNRIHQWKN
jgi:hypothetical protein